MDHDEILSLIDQILGRYGLKTLADGSSDQPADNFRWRINQDKWNRRERSNHFKALPGSLESTRHRPDRHITELELARLPQLFR
jgi:hypothetical protein